MEWEKSIIIAIYNKSDKRDLVITEAYQFRQLHTKCYPIS